MADKADNTDDVQQLRARIKELEEQQRAAEKAGQDARADQLEARIDALEKRLEEQQAPSDDDEPEPEPEEGVVLDASPEPSESGNGQSPGEPLAPRTVTRRVGGRWRTWTVPSEEGSANV